jgi:hypothetical protein
MTDYELGLRHAARALPGWINSTVFSNADLESRRLISEHVVESLNVMADAVASEPEYRLFD